MSEINVVSRTQTIVVEPVSTAVSIINAGQPGRDGVGATLTGYLQAKLLTSQASFAANVETLVQYTLMNGIGWTVSGSTITCTLAGRYLVTPIVNLRHTTTTSAQSVLVRIRQKRGSDTISEVESGDNLVVTNGAGDEGRRAVQAQGIFDCLAGDLIQIVVLPTPVIIYTDPYTNYPRSILTITPIGAAQNPDGWQTASVQTTDATSKTLVNVPIAANKITMVEAQVIARRSGGSAGVNGDGAMYTRYACLKNVTGTPEYIGSVSAVVTQESDSNYNTGFATGLANGTVPLIVTGVANVIIDWQVWYRLRTLP